MRRAIAIAIEDVAVFAEILLHDAAARLALPGFTILIVAAGRAGAGEGTLRGAGYDRVVVAEDLPGLALVRLAVGIVPAAVGDAMLPLRRARLRQRAAGAGAVTAIDAAVLAEAAVWGTHLLLTSAAHTHLAIRRAIHTGSEIAAAELVASDHARGVALDLARLAQLGSTSAQRAVAY